MQFIDVLFTLSTLLIFISCGGVLFSKHIMHVCLYLLAVLIGVAGLYLTLGADFVAATQLMVYVGGVVILMLFAVMLTGGQEFSDKLNRWGKQLIPTMGNKKSYTIGILTGTVFFLCTIKMVGRLASYETTLTELPFKSTVTGIGTLLITDHIFSFEMVSVLLLGALVGAAIIARPGKGEQAALFKKDESSSSEEH